MKNNNLYFIVNKDIKMSSGKTAGQVAHCATIFACDNVFNNNFTDWYGEGLTQPKIILGGKQSLLESLEDDYISIRDNGHTELEPNTLTCVCLGLMSRAELKSDKRFKRLQLHK